jgi:hypothetical protein
MGRPRKNEDNEGSLTTNNMCKARRLPVTVRWTQQGPEGYKGERTRMEDKAKTKNRHKLDVTLLEML